MLHPRLYPDSPHRRASLGNSVIDVRRSVCSGTCPIISFSTRAISEPEIRPLTIILTPWAPPCIARCAACLIARRVRYASLQLVRYVPDTRYASISGCPISIMFSWTLRLVIPSSLLRSCFTRSPSLPINIPGPRRMNIDYAVLRPSVYLHPGDSRIRKRRILFLDAVPQPQVFQHQRPVRRPVGSIPMGLPVLDDPNLNPYGWVFWPMTYASSSSPLP